jgi:hypothetical protein
LIDFFVTVGFTRLLENIEERHDKMAVPKTRCTVQIAACLVCSLALVRAQMKWTPEVRTEQGNLYLVAKDIIISTWYPTVTASVSSLVDRVDTLVNDVADVRAAASSTADTDSKLAAAAAATTALVTATKESLNNRTDRIVDLKVLALETAFDARIAGTRTENKATTDALQFALDDVKAATRAVRWVGHHTKPACSQGDGTKEEVVAHFVVAGQGFVPSIAYTLRLTATTGPSKGQYKEVDGSAKLDVDLSSMTVLEFNYDLLNSAWGTTPGGASVRVEVLNEEGTVIPYSGKAGGDIVNLAVRDKAAAVPRCNGDAGCAVYGTKTKLGINCAQILSMCSTASTGAYYVTLNGRYPKGTIAQCDMKTDGGGWTMFATKRSQGMRVIPKDHGAVSAKCYADGSGDCPGLVPSTEKGAF